MNQSLWLTIKQTLLEKSGETQFGSIKRWAAWILLSLIVLSVIAGLIPGGSIHIGTYLNLSWNHQPADMSVVNALLAATGTYILTGQALSNITDTIQHRNTVKYTDTQVNPNLPDPNALKV